MGSKQDNRLGSDPLDWIKSSKEASKDSIQSNLGKQSTQKNKSEKQSNEESEKNSSQKGLPEGWTRGTFIIQAKYLEKIRSTAYWDRKDIKEVLDEALEAYFSNKSVKPVPKKNK